LLHFIQSIMTATAKITLAIPGSEIPEKHFSLGLKHALYNEPSEYRKPGRLLAVSDIEGNFQSFCRLLVKNKVVDKYLNWVFEDGHLVIVGDCFDRGEQVIECLWLIYMLEEKAVRHGGKVHFILGNHEIMNMNGDWRYIHPKYAFSPQSRRPPTALYGGNDELWKWLCTKNIMEKIGNILFVHGGIAESIVQLNLSVTEINNRSRPFYKQATGLPENKGLYAILNSNQSPFWYRGYYEDSFAEKSIDDVLSHFRVKTIVTGHTIVEHVSTFFSGKVINIDTDHANGCSEGLLVKNNRFYRVNSTGLKVRIK
jgi:hypothetical protein